MRNTQPLVQILAQPTDANTVPRLSAIRTAAMFRRWDQKYIDFIKKHCMKTFEVCVGDGVTTIEDPETGLVARSAFAPDISTAHAQHFGLTLPEGINERATHNPNLRVKPFMRRCFGVRSGNLIDEFQEGVRTANALVLSHIESMEQR
jgi:hypothetical protein